MIGLPLLSDPGIQIKKKITIVMDSILMFLKCIHNIKVSCVRYVEILTMI